MFVGVMWTSLDTICVMGSQGRNQYSDSSYDEANSDEDETDAVDDCSRNHPVVHHAFMFFLLATQSTRCIDKCLQLIVNAG